MKKFENDPSIKSKNKYNFFRKKVVPVLLVGGLLSGNLAFITNNVSAATTNNQQITQTKELTISGKDQKSVNDLADTFQFMYEEAAIYNDQGQIIDFHFDKIEAKYGKDASLDALKQQIATDQGPQVIQNQDGTIQFSFAGCMKESLLDFFGVNAVQAAFNGGIAYYLEKRLWKEAAKIGVKFFVGSSLAGLAATLAYYGGKCAIYG